jgi:ribosomal protein S20
MELHLKKKEIEKARKYFSKFQSILMQVAKSGIINKNTAARKISRISKKISTK